MGLSDLTEERHRLSWAKEIGDRGVHWHALGVTMGEMRGCSFLFFCCCCPGCAKPHVETATFASVVEATSGLSRSFGGAG